MIRQLYYDLGQVVFLVTQFCLFPLCLSPLNCKFSEEDSVTGYVYSFTTLMIMVIVDDNGCLLGISPRGYVVIDSILLFSYIFKVYKCKCNFFFSFVLVIVKKNVTGV